jgi:hypothetical protein
MQSYTIGRERRIGNRRVLFATLAFALACGGGYDGPTAPATGNTGGEGGDPVPGNGLVTRMEADPIGDTFHNTGGKQWDLIALTVSRDTGGVTAKLDFTANVLSPMSGDTTAIIGFVEFDLDQDFTTGGESVVDHFRLDGASATMGVDATVDMSRFAADSTVAVYDSRTHVTGRIKPVFEGKSITIRVPRAMLQNDDGFLNAATIIGAIHRPTDFAPQVGHLTLDAPR